MKIRCQTPQGRKIISDLTPESSLKELKNIIFSLSNIPTSNQKISLGYPPRLISSNAVSDDTTLKDIDIKHGELLTIEQNSTEHGVNSVTDSQHSKATAIPNDNNQGASDISSTTDQKNKSDSEFEIPKLPSVPPSGDISELGEFVRRQIPSDNSCLFHSVSYAILGATARPKFQELSRNMRELVVNTISSDPVFYNEGVLGMEVSEYKKWIRGNDHWGGPIELHALSSALNIEIVAFDVKTQRADHYTPSKEHKSESNSETQQQQQQQQETTTTSKYRIYLVFDGIHYDTLALTPLLSTAEATDDIRVNPSAISEEVDMTLFSPNDRNAWSKAEAVIRALQKKRQFTDLQEFTLRCLTCQKGLKGQNEATEHAKATGHTNFSEYN